MTAEFGGKPVSDSNLTEWKGGGYRDWLIEQESLSEVRQLLEEAGQFERLGSKDLTQRLALWLSVRCAIEARKQREAGADPDLAAFGRLCRGLSALRRGEHSAKRLALEETRLDILQRPGSKRLEKLFWEWTERPDIKKKLFPKPLTFKQKMNAIKEVYGMDPDGGPQVKQNRPEPRENQAASVESQKAASNKLQTGVQKQEDRELEQTPEL